MISTMFALILICTSLVAALAVSVRLNIALSHRSRILPLLRPVAHRNSHPYRDPASITGQNTSAALEPALPPALVLWRCPRCGDASGSFMVWTCCWHLKEHRKGSPTPACLEAGGHHHVHVAADEHSGHYRPTARDGQHLDFQPGVAEPAHPARYRHGKVEVPRVRHHADLEGGQWLPPHPVARAAHRAGRPGASQPIVHPRHDEGQHAAQVRHDDPQGSASSRRRAPVAAPPRCPRPARRR